MGGWCVFFLLFNNADIFCCFIFPCGVTLSFLYIVEFGTIEYVPTVSDKNASTCVLNYYFTLHNMEITPYSLKYPPPSPTFPVQCCRTTLQWGGGGVDVDDGYILLRNKIIRANSRAVNNL